jgi:hypothetical protein
MGEIDILTPQTTSSFLGGHRTAAPERPSDLRPATLIPWACAGLRWGRDRHGRTAEPRLRVLRSSGDCLRPKAQPAVSSVGGARQAQDGRLSPDRLLCEVRPTGAHALGGLVGNVVRGLRYVGS